MFISHARTPEELKAEVCSDIMRRLEFLDGQINVIARNASAKAKLNCAKIEMESMLRFWTELTIVRPRRNRSTGPSVILSTKETNTNEANSPSDDNAPGYVQRSTGMVPNDKSAVAEAYRRNVAGNSTSNELKLSSDVTKFVP